MAYSFLQNIQIIKKVFLETCRSRSHCIRLILALGLLGVGIYLNVLVPFAFKEIIDKLSLGNSNFLEFSLFVYGIVWVISQVSVHLRELLMNSVIERSVSILGIQAFSQLYKLPQQFHLNKKTGELTNIIRQAQRSLPVLLWGATLYIIPVSLEFVTVFCLLVTNYSLTHMLILGGTLSLFSIYTLFTTKLAIRQRALSIEADKEIESKSIDWLLNLELIRLSGKTEYALQDYKNSFQKREKLEVSFLNALGSVRIGQSIILGIGLSILTFSLGNAVRSHELTIGDFVLFNAYFIQFIGPISILGHVFKDIKKAMLEIRGVLDLLNTPLILQDKENAVRLKSKNFTVEFRNVSFKYQNTFVFKNLSFKILPGEMAVITGSSGSGKSTLLKLLLRSYEPTEGQVLINNIDINDISLDSLREEIGIILQENILLDTNILNNIKFFNLGISLRKLKEATKKAYIADSIESLPDEYNTLVGEKGAKFSGGERQRIALARVFAKNPKICIMDEPTSALDGKTEELISKNIKTHLPFATKIIVSHRLSLINKADKVIILNSL